MSRTPSLPGAVVAVALLGPACAAEEAAVVRAALDRPVQSARVALRVAVEEDGTEVARLSLRGPLRSNGARRPASLDWRLRLGGAQQRRLAARIVSTGENAFVRHRGTWFEVGERRVARLGLPAGGGLGALGDLFVVGIDWFPRSAGRPQDSRAGGVATRRVAGRLDVSAALERLAPLLRLPQLRAALGGHVPRLGQEEIRALDALVSDPRVVLEAGRDDGKLRRLTARFAVRDPRGPAAVVRVELGLSAVDQRVRIAAPASGRPIGRLLRRLDPSRRG